MKQYKQLLCLTSVLAMLLTGCGADPHNPDTDVSLSHQQQGEQEVEAPYRFSVGYSGDGYTQSFEQWRQLLLEQTDGNVELMLFGENVLGEGKDMVQAVQLGTMSIVACSTSVTTQFVPQTAVMDIPSCFEEYSQPFRVYDGAVFDGLNEYYRQAGLELLYLRTGEYWLLSGVEPITTLEQLDGLRIRTSGSSFHNKLYDSLGIERVEDVGLSGLAYILDEKGVDGIETTYSILNSQDLLQAQPYALKGPFFVMSSAIVMNYEAFHSMPQDYQDGIKQTLAQVLNQKQSELEQSEESMVVNTLGEEDLARLRQLAQPLLDEILALVDDELVQALVEENKS